MKQISFHQITSNLTYLYVSKKHYICLAHWGQQVFVECELLKHPGDPHRRLLDKCGRRKGDWYRPHCGRPWAATSTLSCLSFPAPAVFCSSVSYSFLPSLTSVPSSPVIKVTRENRNHIHEWAWDNSMNKILTRWNEKSVLPIIVFIFFCGHLMIFYGYFLPEAAIICDPV